MYKYLAMLLAFGLVACQPATESAPDMAAEVEADDAPAAVEENRLASVLSAQPEDV